MAKKKRRIVEEPEAEYEFTPTEFNEREFILKDIYGTKVFLVTIVIGLLVGILGAAICAFWSSRYAWAVVTILAFVVLGMMKKILELLGFRPEMLDMKTMLGNYFMYLALSLGVGILLVNPPFFG